MSRWLIWLPLMAAISMSCTGAMADTLTPADAIQRTAHGSVAFGTYSFVVRSVGAARGEVYLNSEEDYRSPRNLSAEVSPGASRDLKAAHGDDLAAFFVGKTVWVRGDARRVPIDVVAGGMPIGKGYYQHDIAVTDVSQISLTPPD